MSPQATTDLDLGIVSGFFISKIIWTGRPTWYFILMEDFLWSACMDFQWKKYARSIRHQRVLCNFEKIFELWFIDRPLMLWFSLFLKSETGGIQAFLYILYWSSQNTESIIESSDCAVLVIRNRSGFRNENDPIRWEPQSHSLRGQGRSGTDFDKQSIIFHKIFCSIGPDLLKRLNGSN